MLKSRRLTVENTFALRTEILKQIEDALSTMILNKRLQITIEVIEPLENLKKRYFSMVSELGAHAGYSSPKDRGIFKHQIKSQIGITSIGDVSSEDVMRGIIEELHNIGSNHYDYTFKDNGSNKPFEVRLPDGKN